MGKPEDYKGGGGDADSKRECQDTVMDTTTTTSIAATTTSITTRSTSVAMLESTLLGWSERQSHILSGAGRSNDLYRKPLFPFSEEELPHYHKARGSSHEVFREWRRQVLYTYL